MNKPARLRVGLTGLTLAEFFREKEGQDVLLFIDNISALPRPVPKYRLSGPDAFGCGLSAHPPDRDGQLKNALPLPPRLHHIGASHLRPRHDPTDPAPATTFAHLMRRPICPGQFPSWDLPRRGPIGVLFANPRSPDPGKSITASPGGPGSIAAYRNCRISSLSWDG